MAYMRDASGRRLDEFAIRPGTRTNRTVLLGDSFWERNGGPRLAPTGLVTWDAKGPFVWCNYLLGQPFRVVKNAGVGGQQMSAYLARVPADVDAYAPDWVIGTGGVNDIGQGRTATQVIADLTALFDYLITERGYRVTWNTITPVTSWSATQFTHQFAVNHWLRTQAPSLWPSLIVIDVLREVYDVTTAAIPVAWRSDATHLNAAGAFRYGRAMANALRAFVPNSFVCLETVNGSSTPNLLANGRFANPSSGVASGWTGTGGSAVHSQVARTDEPAGFWQRMEITAEGWATLAVANIVLDPAKVTPGTDYLQLAVECQVSGLLAAPTALTQRFNARVQLYNASSVLLTQMDGAYSDGGYDNPLITSAHGVLMTPEFPVPATATKATVSLTAIGTGRFEWDKATLAKVYDPE